MADRRIRSSYGFWSFRQRHHQRFQRTDLVTETVQVFVSRVRNRRAVQALVRKAHCLGKLCLCFLIFCCRFLQCLKRGIPLCLCGFYRKLCLVSFLQSCFISCLCAVQIVEQCLQVLCLFGCRYRRFRSSSRIRNLLSFFLVGRIQCLLLIRKLCHRVLIIRSSLLINSIRCA